MLKACIALVWTPSLTFSGNSFILYTPNLIMGSYYIHVPSMERGALTARELISAQMPCYFGDRDYTSSEFFFSPYQDSPRHVADTWRPF